MLKLTTAVCLLFGVCCAQVYIPTSYSTSTGIVRNVPTTLLGIPANTYISDGNRVFIAAQIPNQYIATRLNENVATENRNRDDKTQNLRKLANEKDEITKALLRDDKNEKLKEINSQRDDSIKITEEQLERIRDILKSRNDKNDENVDKEMLRTLLKESDYTDTLGRVQGFNNNDRVTTFNRFRGINEYDVPEHRPIVHGIKTKYRIGDSLRANSTSKNSRPAANLTWTINDVPPNPLHVRNFRIMKDHKTELETSMIGIQFVITQQHFQNGKLKIRCTSQLHNVYSQKTEKVIEQERPKQTHSSTNSVNLVHHNSIPSDPYNPYSVYHDSEIYDRKDSFSLQHGYKGDVDSLSAGNAGYAFTHCDAHEMFVNFTGIIIASYHGFKSADVC